MSDVGKTLLKGHTLRDEGGVWYGSHGKLMPTWRRDVDRHAKCSCGALSPANISQNAAKKWHREHKDSLR